MFIREYTKTSPDYRKTFEKIHQANQNIYRFSNVKVNYSKDQEKGKRGELKYSMSPKKSFNENFSNFNQFPLVKKEKCKLR
jgi:hypothetical protein